MQATQQVTTKDLLEKLAETELRRRLTAQRIFRELRKGDDEERSQPESDLPRLTKTPR